MFNIGQVVHDKTNNRPLIYAGFKIDDEFPFVRFFTVEDGIPGVLDFEHVPFEYECYFDKDGSIHLGAYVLENDLQGLYFGLIREEIVVEYVEVIRKTCKNVPKTS